MLFQKHRFGFVRAHSQFFSVPVLTFNRPANALRVRPNLNRAFLSDLPNNSLFKLKGYESTLMVLITKWQKGFKNHPFRHIRFLGFSRI